MSEHETIPPTPNVPTDLSALDPAGDAVRDIAARLSILPEILRAVNESGANVQAVSVQMHALGTAIETLSREIRALTKRVKSTESRIGALERRVTELERKIGDGR